MHIDRRIPFLDLHFDAANMDAALVWLRRSSIGEAFRYVVTPNVDHVVRLHSQGAQRPPLREAYLSADLCLCDSRVLSRLARWCGIGLPTVTGSDLTDQLLHRVVEAGDRIVIVGGDTALRQSLVAEFPQVEWIQHQPPMGLSSNPAAIEAAAAFVEAQRARFSFIAVGSPQQELIALRIKERGDSRGTALCIGAALQFVVKQERRAPAFVRRIGFEWAYRLAVQPRRMWRRYLVDGPKIFLIAWRWRKAATSVPR